MKSGSEILRLWRDDNQIHSLENERGITSLNQLARDLGYREQGYRNGSPLEEFLRDNPGCCEAIFKWVEEQIDSSPEWQESLSIEQEPSEVDEDESS